MENYPQDTIKELKDSATKKRGLIFVLTARTLSDSKSDFLS